MPEPKKPLNLKKQRPPAPPPPAQAQPGARRTLPGFMAPGEIVRPEGLTPFERAQFEKLGVAPGTPVPGDLANIVAEIRGEADPLASLGLAPDFQVAVPKTVEVDDLTPEQQARVRAVIAETAAMASAIGDIPTVPGAGAGVNEAIAAAAEMDRIRRGPSVSLVDDRITGNQATPPPASPPPGPRPTLQAGALAPGQAYVHRGRVEDLPPEATARPQQAATPPPAATDPASETGAADARNCPHCGWDQTLRDGIDPTDVDKYGFLWSILGGPEKRFTKQYELMGGQILLNFRTLTSREADLALLQIAHDYRRGEIAGNTDWWQRWMDYRMAFALESITSAAAGKTYVGPDSLDDIEYDPPAGPDGKPLPSTPLPALWEHLEGSHLYNESLRRAVSLAYAGFVDLVKKLENNYENPDFWRGIAEPA